MLPCTVHLKFQVPDESLDIIGQSCDWNCMSQQGHGVDRQGEGGEVISLTDLRYSVDQVPSFGVPNYLPRC